MDIDDLTIEEKCENLMKVVVESRKRFGKMSVDYDRKISIMENKILNHQLETISSYRIKSKNLPARADLEVVDTSSDFEDFVLEEMERKNRVDDLIKKIKETEAVVIQHLGDNLERKVHQPLTAEAMLKQAKEKIVKKSEIKHEMVLKHEN